MLKGQTSSRLPHAGLSPSEVVLSAEEKGPFLLPQIGLSSANNNRPLSQKEIARLKALKLTHLRVDLNLFALNWEEVLRKANKEAAAIGVPLEAALLLSDTAEEELDRLGNELQSVKPRIARWLIFHKAEPSTNEKWIHMARRRLASFDSKAEIGSGTNAYFTELNRGGPRLGATDGPESTDTQPSSLFSVPHRFGGACSASGTQLGSYMFHYSFCEQELAEGPVPIFNIHCPRDNLRRSYKDRR